MQLQIRLTPKALVCLTSIMLLGFAASLGMPFNIDAIALSFSTSNTEAGLVASLEMAAIAAGNLLFARFGRRLSSRRVYAASLATILTLNLAATLAPSVTWLIFCRVPAGFALGAVVATVMMTAGRSDKPEQTFGFINAMVGVMGMVMAFVLPRALGLHQIMPGPLAFSEVDGLFLVYGLCSLCALLFVAGTPVTPPLETGAHDSQRPALFVGWVSLIGLGLVFFGHAQLALFIVKIGRDVGLSAENIGYVFMAGSLAGIVLPLIAGYVGARYRALVPIAVILTAIALSATALARAHSPIDFFFAAPVFAMLPIAIMPIFLGCLARFDPTGSLAGAHAAFVLIGGAVAPFIGGALSDAGGYTFNGYAVVACVLVGSALMYAVIRKADVIRTNQRHREQEDSPAPAA